MVDLNNIHNLIHVLQALSANDTASVKKAEKILIPFLKKAHSAVLLMQVLKNCDDVAARHHAALLLRKKISGFYSKYNAQQQNTLKTELVGLLMSEPTGNIATAIAGIIAAVAKSVYKGKGQWNELFQLLLQLVQDPNEKHRTLTFKLLSEVSFLILIGMFHLIFAFTLL
jgi:nitrate reductase assembly molybdenum cofactor insertion protein NarJ